MKFTPYIITLLEKKCGQPIQTSADCNFLALDIESRTRVHIGATTLKRLIGFLPDERKPHATTLNIVASYLGYKNWEELDAVSKKSNSAIGRHENEIRSSDINKGSIVEITYLPDRRIVFEYAGANQFTVRESTNSKLQKGDKAEILHFVQKHPLYAKNITREGKVIGEYTAGIISGISSIKITE